LEFVILLDTHVLVWLSLEPSRLSKKAIAAIREARAGDGIAIASISIWELAWLAQNGRIETSESVNDFVRQCVSKVIIRSITTKIASVAVGFPDSYPRDPQDRLIGATSVAEGMPLVTADRLIRRSKFVKTIW
jgi:PIN domain nuclease of toxin-antitoxin system